MGKSITLFVWGYQPHFRIALKHRAQSVLQSIAPVVQPNALLVGIRTPEKSDGHLVCVEPEDEDWDPNIFFGCAARADSIYTTHPDHSRFYGDAPSMRDKPENIRKKSVREAVQEVTSIYDSQHGTSTFCGWPTRVEGYYVVPILQFDKSQLMGYPHLPAPIRFQDWTSSTGLIQSVIECLLEEASASLEGKEPGRFFDTFPLDGTALLTDAGGRFCDAISLTTGNIMLQNVFQALNVISSLPHEGAEAIGELVFASVNAQVEIRVSLNEPVPLYDHRLARKMIEMSGCDLLCVCHGAEGISGFGSLRAAAAGGTFRVVFSGHYKWDLYYENSLVMKAAFGVPHLPSVRFNEDVFRSNVRRIISDVHADVENRLWRIVEAAMEQRHGTIIVVSATAEEEAKRLRKQSIGVKPIELTPDLVRHLSGIDGAILIDSEGTCHAVGVILDGMASDEGDPSRGSRYNSAIRYIASARSPTICLIVSEDGHIDMRPQLRLQVRRSEIESKVGLLKTATIENHNKTINWLNDHRFYLTAEQCDIVNKELARIRSAPIEVGEIRLVIQPFVPHPAMNDSYYLL
jgi:hypothetical protein